MSLFTSTIKYITSNIRRGAFAVGLMLLTIPAPASMAQSYDNWGYHPEWFGWGIPSNWNGWGSYGTGTVPGSILEGWGAYLNGAGYYNVNTAAARAINFDTWFAYTSVMNDRQMHMNYSNYLRRLRRHENIMTARRHIFERLRDNPNASDIKSGDAINVKMRILMNPGYSARVVEELTIPVLPEVLDQLVVIKPSEGIFTSIKDVKSVSSWPMLFRQNRYGDMRTRLETIWPQAWASLKTNGFVDDSLVKDINVILDDLRKKADSEYGTIDQMAYSYARTFLKSRKDTLRVFQSQSMTEFLQEIATPDVLTLGQLLEALSTRSMQFYPAEDKEQTATYERFYAVLRGAPSTVLSEETFSKVFDGSDDPQ